jgi:hypothetical protein
MVSYFTLPPRAEHPAVAPLAESGEDGDEVLPLGSELVLVTAPVHACVDAGQHPVPHEVVEPLRQDVLRDVRGCTKRPELSRLPA